MLFLLVILAQVAVGYSDSSLEVTVSVNDDGTAHVAEKATIFINNQNELEAFDYNALVGVSIADWTRFSKNVKYHMNGPATFLKITGGRISANMGVITLEYALTSPVFLTNQSGSRTTVYELKKNVLGFESSKAGETIIPAGTVLTFELPIDAQSPVYSPEVSSRDGRVISWAASHGAIVGTWKLLFQRERSLSSEVNEFFISLYKDVISLVPFIILLAIVVLVVYKFTQKK